MCRHLLSQTRLLRGNDVERRAVEAEKISVFIPFIDREGVPRGRGSDVVLVGIWCTYRGVTGVD